MERSLEPLDISQPSGIDRWHKRFNLYAQTNHRITDENKVAFYLTLVGKEAYDLLTDLAYPEEVDTKTIQELQNLLMGHLRSTQYELTERSRFHSLSRHPGESLRSFLLRVQQQAAKCNFGNQLTIQMRDRIVTGVGEPEVQKKLLREEV